jgi:hypothetical protein
MKTSGGFADLSVSTQMDVAKVYSVDPRFATLSTIFANFLPFFADFFADFLLTRGPQKSAFL